MSVLPNSDLDHQVEEVVVSVDEEVSVIEAGVVDVVSEVIVEDSAVEEEEDTVVIVEMMMVSEAEGEDSEVAIEVVEDSGVEEVDHLADGGVQDEEVQVDP